MDRSPLENPACLASNKRIVSRHAIINELQPNVFMRGKIGVRFCGMRGLGLNKEEQ